MTGEVQSPSQGHGEASSGRPSLDPHRWSHLATGPRFALHRGAQAGPGLPAQGWAWGRGLLRFCRQLLNTWVPEQQGAECAGACAPTLPS